MDKSIVKSIMVYSVYRGGWNYAMKCYEQEDYTTLNESIFYELILRI